jgi:hypothetical protein
VNYLGLPRGIDNPKTPRFPAGKEPVGSSNAPMKSQRLLLKPAQPGLFLKIAAARPVQSCFSRKIEKKRQIRDSDSQLTGQRIDQL